MTKVFKEIISLLSVFVLLNFTNVSWSRATETVTDKKVEKTDSLDDLTLPSDLGDFKLNNGGAVYYSPVIKNKILIPVYFWGEVQKAGLHYVPAGTSFVKGLSIAGGPTSLALMKKVKVFRTEEGKNQTYVFDLQDEANEQVFHDFIFKPSDIVRIDRDDYFQNRAYYTSLIGIGVTVLSGILTFQAIKDD